MVARNLRSSFPLRCGEVIRYSTLYEDLRYSKEFFYVRVKVTSRVKNTYYTEIHTALHPITPSSLQ